MSGCSINGKPLQRQPKLKYTETGFLNERILFEPSTCAEIRFLSSSQQQTEQSLRELSEAQKRTDRRLESFIFEPQRLIIKHSESIEQLKGMTERLKGVLAYLICKEGRDELNP